MEKSSSAERQPDEILIRGAGSALRRHALDRHCGAAPILSESPLTGGLKSAIRTTCGGAFVVGSALRAPSRRPEINDQEDTDESCVGCCRRTCSIDRSSARPGRNGGRGFVSGNSALPLNPNGCSQQKWGPGSLPS